MVELINLLDVEVKNIKIIDGLVLENMSLKSPFYLSGRHLFYKKQVEEMEKEASNIDNYYELSYHDVSHKLSEIELQSFLAQINQALAPVINKTLFSMVAAM